MTDTPIVLQATGITKRFPGVLANDDVSFRTAQGEVHALLGENGAGKTTLMNILYGLYKPDAGKVLVNNQPLELDSTKDAISHGIGMVHQHFMLIPVFSVTENIMLGSETDHRARGSGPVPPLDRLERKTVAAMVRELSHKYGLDVEPEAIVGDLPVGVQQRVEIVKALYRKASILILDEPTAVLTPQEAEDLTRIMHELTKQGVSIIFITHKLKEVLAIADRITVMRAGKVVGTTTPAETSEHQLAAMMVGREVILTVEKGPAKPQEDILKVENLVVQDKRGLETVRGVSFSVREGEILGIAGVQGNGQTELAEALTGLTPSQIGENAPFGQGPDQPHAARVDRDRAGAHPGGPSAPRAGDGLQCRRQHGPVRLLPSRPTANAELSSPRCWKPTLSNSSASLMCGRLRPTTRPGSFPAEISKR